MSPPTTHTTRETPRALPNAPALRSMLVYFALRARPSRFFTSESYATVHALYTTPLRELHTGIYNIVRAERAGCPIDLRPA